MMIDDALATAMMQTIEQEYQHSVNAVCVITQSEKLLAGSPILQRSIANVLHN